MNETFEIIRTGVLATIQDLGRWGWQRFGMPVSGAMDLPAMQVANLLAGNPRGAAVVEIAMGGLAMRALRDTAVAICGGDLAATLDGAPAPMWKNFAVHAGQELSWRRPVRGCWAYLAVAGGIDVPVVMGSRSTYLRAKLGGLDGRALAKGDILRVAPPKQTHTSRLGGRHPETEIPDYSTSVIVRVILGPQLDAFEDQAVCTLCSQEYEVSPQSDRMGYRLTGPLLRHKCAADILSDALTFGSIQVPADGLPIVLMADRQTTGGYAKIATIISADLPRVAQLPPGGKVRFQVIDIQQAQRLAVEQERFLSRMEVACSDTANVTNEDK